MNTVFFSISSGDRQPSVWRTALLCVGTCIFVILSVRLALSGSSPSWKFSLATEELQVEVEKQLLPLESNAARELAGNHCLNYPEIFRAAEIFAESVYQDGRYTSNLVTILGLSRGREV